MRVERRDVRFDVRFGAARVRRLNLTEGLTWDLVRPWQNFAADVIAAQLNTALYNSDGSENKMGQACARAVFARVLHVRWVGGGGRASGSCIVSVHPRACTRSAK